MDGDGLPEIIVNKNEFSSGTFFERIRIYEKGEIYDLIWDEDSLTTSWKTRKIKGYIADYQIKDVDNDGDEELVVAAVAPEEDRAGPFSSFEGMELTPITVTYYHQTTQRNL